MKIDFICELWTLKADLTMEWNGQTIQEKDRTYYTPTEKAANERIKCWKTVYKHGLVIKTQYQEGMDEAFHYINNEVISW